MSIFIPTVMERQKEIDDVTSFDDGRGRRFDRKGASAHLLEAHGICRAPSTLAVDAVKGSGPVIEYVGRRPTYRECDLADWVRAQTRRVNSTSELQEKSVA